MVGIASRVVAVSGASAVQLVSLTISSLVLAKILPVDGFAITRIVTAYMVILTILGHFCLHDAVASYVAGARTKEEQSEYIVTGTMLTLAISGLVTIIAEIVVYGGGMWTGELRDALASTALFLPVASLSIVYSSLFQAVGSYRKLVFSTVLVGVVPALVIPVATTIWGLFGWVAGRGVSWILLLFIQIWLARHLLCELKIRKPVVVELLKFARVQIFSGSLSMLLQSLDVILLERISKNLSSIAAYALASQFARALLFVPGVLGRVYFRQIANAAYDRNELLFHLRRFVIRTTLLCGGGAIGLGALAPPAIQLVYGQAYAECLSVLRIMCVGAVISGLWSALSVINVAIKKPSYSVATSATGVVVGAVCVSVLVPVFGASGAAWAMNLAYLCGVSVGAVLLLRPR